MNAPIIRLYAFFAVLFGVLVFATSWWSVFGAERLRDNASNRRPLLAEERIKRGTIRAADGKVLARSVKIDKERYRRTYPTDSTFAHAIGYSFTKLGRSGLEQYRNDELSGRRTELIGAVDSLLGERDVGDSIRTTLVPKAQQAAIDGLRGRKGAVVALEPSTGKVLAMVSTPSYNPNNLDEGDKFKELATDDANSPLVNRATQAGYPPGSTFKTVTATAALDSGEFTPESTVSGENGKKVSGVPLNNFGNEDFGNITLTDALTNSVNTVWAEVGEKLGKKTMAEYMTKYGFYKQPRSTSRATSCWPRRARPGRQAAGADLATDRRRAHGDRPGQAARHAAADGHRGGHDRHRRRADGAAHHAEDRRPRRAHAGRDRGRTRRASHERGHRSCVDRDDEAGRQGGHRHGGGARGRRGRGQDGHRGDRHRTQHQRPLVHRLRGRRRGRGRARAGAGRTGGVDAAPIAKGVLEALGE